MITYIKRLAPFAFAAIIVTSCSESKATSQEEVEIQRMDSTAKVAKENSEKLEEQTKKVEASLEKLDSEFDNKK